MRWEAKVDQQGTDEIEKLHREQAKSDKELLEAVRWLTGKSQFQLFCARIEGLAQAKGASLLMPLATRDAVLVQEFEKGTIKGLLLAAQFSRAIIQDDESSHKPDEEAS